MNLFNYILVPFFQSGVNGIYLVAAVVLIFVVFLFSMFRRYKRCPSDKILVVYGKTGGEGRSCPKSF